MFGDEAAEIFIASALMLVSGVPVTLELPQKLSLLDVRVTTEMLGEVGAAGTTFSDWTGV